MDKYYTPSIEEFHVGFEYEWRYKIENEWRQSVFDINTGPIMPGNGAINGFHPTNNDISDFRTKYLDKEDIEGLGWTYYEGIDSVRYNYTSARQNTGSQYRIGYYGFVHYPQDNTAFIFNLNQNENGNYDPQPIFQGKIKNKSELKKIMQQLMIIP